MGQSQCPHSSPLPPQIWRQWGQVAWGIIVPTSPGFSVDFVWAGNTLLCVNPLGFRGAAVVTEPKLYPINITHRTRAMSGLIVGTRCSLFANGRKNQKMLMRGRTPCSQARRAQCHYPFGLNVSVTLLGQNSCIWCILSPWSLAMIL